MVRGYCPHCKKHINHKKPCKKFTQKLEDEYREKVKEKEELEKEIAIFKNQFPHLWKYFSEKFAEYDYHITESNDDNGNYYTSDAYTESIAEAFKDNEYDDE